MSNPHFEPDLETLRQTPCPLWLGDANGFCHFVNPALVRSLGVHADDLLGQHWQTLLPSADLNPLLERLSALARRQRPFKTRLHLLSSARIRTFKVAGTCFQTSADAPERLLLALQDVTYTERVSFRRQLRSEQLRVCFEQTPVGMAFLDNELRVVRANPFLGPLLARSQSALEGRFLSDLVQPLIPPDSQAQLLRICAQTLELGRPHVLNAWPLTLPAAPQHPKFTDWEIRRIETTENIPIGVLLTVSDVTRAHHLLEELARAHESLELRVQERTTELAEANSVIQDQAHQKAAVAELGGKALSGTPLPALFEEAAQRILPILRADFCSIRELTADHQHLILRSAAGWPPEIRLESLSAGTLSQSGFTILSREPVYVDDMDSETRFRVSDSVRKSGSNSSVSVLLSLEGRPFGTLSVFSKSRRRFTKEDSDFLLAVSNVLAAALQRQRAEEGLRLAREQAEQANRAKTEFLSRMSHELRTPLNAILGFAQLLELDAPNPAQRESITHIARAGKHLLGLINEVLEISRIEALQMELLLEPVELAGLLQPCIELLQPLASKNSIRIQVTSPPSPIHVKADRQKLQQVVLNLLSNAIKYNHPNGLVSITIQPADTTVRILFADSGPGIPEDKRVHLFTPFHRLGAETSDIEGSGLGLSLCKNLLEAMDGSIELESQTGHGCLFTAQLPLARPSDPPETRIETAPRE